MGKNETTEKHASNHVGLYLVNGEKTMTDLRKTIIWKCEEEGQEPKN